MNSEQSQSKTSNHHVSEHAPFRKILIGLDISDQTSGILKIAKHFMQVNSQIIICNVAQMVTSVEANDVDGFPSNQQERKTLDDIKELLHDEFGNDSERIEVKILHGDPAERISEYANYLNCDLIIVGSRSQGALRKALLGSVSGSVVSRAMKSVLVVR